MATRGNIAIYDKETKIAKSIYNHFDSYYNHLGKILVNHYDSTDKVNELISHGDSSYIDETIDKCQFYHRDYSKDLIIKETKLEFDKIIQLRDNEYLYVWVIQDKQWLIY